jgi:hypothetical protein
MCTRIVIDGKAQDRCACALTWEEIMALIAHETQRPNVGEELIVRHTEDEYAVEVRRTPGCPHV